MTPVREDAATEPDPGRNRCKVYVNDHQLAPPVTRLVELPSHWVSQMTESATPNDIDNL